MATPVNNTPVSNSYPPHKTISLSVDKPLINSETVVEKTATNAAVKTNTTPPYPQHKTVPITETSTQNQTPKVETKMIETPVVTAVEKEETKNILTVSDTGSYPTHKTVVLNTSETTEKPLATTVPVEQKAKTVETPVVTTNKKEEKTNTVAISNENSYPTHKTVILNTSVISENTATPTNQTEQKINAPVTPVVENQKTETVATKVETPLTSAVQNTTIPVTAYQNHKTFYFVAEQKPLQTQEQPQVVKASDSTSTKTEEKLPLSTATKVQTKQDVNNVPVISKAKSPAPWIIGTAAVILATAGTYWFSSRNQGTLNEEITALKQRNDSLATNIKKLEKDLHFDDVIARAGKLDAKNNIIVANDANASEIVRICFSVAANPRALSGKKTVYVRIVDASNNVLSASNSNTFDFNGAQTTYSLKQEIVYKKDELMLCIDYKPSEKLEKGAYKAEIYNEGVLDATTTFELK